MSEAVTQEEPQQPSARFIKLVLSSSLATALIALLGTLTGLMYRTGSLGVYGVSTEMFMPESATELAYWGFWAVTVTWSDTWSWLGASIKLVLVAAALYTAVIMAAVAVSLWSEKNGDVIKKRLTFLKSTKQRFAAVSGVAFLGIAAAPWVLLAIPAFVIAIPIFGYSAGKTVTEKSRRYYETQVKENKYQCHGLSGASGPIGQCPMVVAQSKERIAYLDGDRVHVIPSQGVSVSWTPKPLPSPSK